VTGEVTPELVNRCQAGDPTAFDELVTLTQNSVYNLAYRVLGDKEDAQDAAQEAYVRIWQGLPAFRSESKFSTWLYRVVINTCLNRQRQLRRQLQVVESDIILETIQDPGPEPLKQTLEHDISGRIWKAVESLDSKYRLVITLFYQEEMSYSEIAGLLTLPIGTVKAHLNRARVALARSLQGEYGER